MSARPSPDPAVAGLFAELRAAARVVQERFIVGIRAEGERQRIGAALGAEGSVVAVTTARAAVDELAGESFELCFIDRDDRAPGFDPVAAARDVRPFTDLVVLTPGDATGLGQLFAGEGVALLPRPLPAADPLLRAHLRWLASLRRSRTRGLLLRNALARQQASLARIEPALAGAVAEIVAEAPGDPAVLVMGDGEIVRAVAGRHVQASPDVVVIAVGPTDDLRTRLPEARQRAGGAAVVVVDAASSPERLGESIYGGARAYLERADLEALGRVVASAAARRRAEVTGRRLIETLARFGAFADPGGEVSTGARDLDARLIADVGAQTGPVVPSGHEVLVVDDEMVVLTVLREALRRGGYRVTTAQSAEEAIELLRARTFDLVLTDKNLPGASGLEVLRVARTLTPAPAVVLITGYSSYDSAVEALDIGALDYIEKPIRDLEALRFRIRRALSRRDEQLSRPQDAAPASTARVLLVEIEGERRKILASFLGRRFQVTAVANGDEALTLLREQRFDVVLADRNLPGMSGLRVIEQAQKLLPHCASVLYTAYPSYESVKDAFEAGVDAFVVRPSEDLKSLADKVEGALRSRGGILLG